MSNEEILELVEAIDKQMTIDHLNDDQSKIIGYYQQLGKERKMRIAASIFLNSDGRYSDIEIEQMLKSASEEYSLIPTISSSAIGRYLTNPSLIQFFGETKYRFILQKRQENLKIAKSTGGTNYSHNNVAIKDETGRFVGSVPRR